MKLIDRRTLLGLVCTILALGAWPAATYALGDLNEASCPNAELSGFRTSLPDCRAYELISPKFTDGQGPKGVYIAADGSRIIELTDGTYAGVESNRFGPYYEARRSSSGWQSTPLSPAARDFPAQELVGASPDLSKTLWEAHTSAQSIYAKDLYVKEDDGEMVRVGPMVPPSAEEGELGGEKGTFVYGSELSYMGASRDLSHVVFASRSEAPLWPGDETTEEGGVHAQSLYEYSGVGNERPELVGVSSAGQLISDCETSLGSYNHEDTYNAVSADGQTVFFTAVGENQGEACGGRFGAHTPEVSEVYARLRGFETVAVSEPTREQCEKCDHEVENPASEGGARRPATFAGASEDGSKVFFLTRQEMFAGDSTVNLYQYDFDGPRGDKLQQVSTGSAEPNVLGVARVSEDGSHVYFVAEGTLTSGPNREGREPVAEKPNLYVYEQNAQYPRGHMAFVATLTPSDESDWAEIDEREVQATPDGEFLVFVSAAPLTPDDPGGVNQVFEYDAATETLVRVSRAQAGFTAGSESANLNAAQIPRASFSGQPVPASPLAISSDGGTVVFHSGAALTPESVAASELRASTVYEYRNNSNVADGDVYSLSEVTSKVSAQQVGTDESGDDVFFKQVDPLLSEVGDSTVATYDARVGGGFVEPSSSKCESEACLGTASSPSMAGTPASALTTAAVGAPPAPATQPLRPAGKPKRKPRAVKCKRGKIRKGNKCVRKPSARAKKSSTDRRTGR